MTLAVFFFGAAFFLADFLDAFFATPFLADFFEAFFAAFLEAFFGAAFLADFFVAISYGSSNEFGVQNRISELSVRTPGTPEALTPERAGRIAAVMRCVFAESETGNSSLKAKSGMRSLKAKRKIFRLGAKRDCSQGANPHNGRRDKQRAKEPSRRKEKPDEQPIFLGALKPLRFLSLLASRRRTILGNDRNERTETSASWLTRSVIRS